MARETKTTWAKYADVEKYFCLSSTSDLFVEVEYINGLWRSCVCVQLLGGEVGKVKEGLGQTELANAKREAFLAMKSWLVGLRILL